MQHPDLRTREVVMNTDRRRRPINRRVGWRVLSATWNAAAPRAPLPVTSAVAISGEHLFQLFPSEARRVPSVPSFSHTVRYDYRRSGRVVQRGRLSNHRATRLG